MAATPKVMDTANATHQRYGRRYFSRPPRKLRVVDFSEFFFFAEVAHSRSSSSSSNCLRCRSA